MLERSWRSVMCVDDEPLLYTTTPAVGCRRQLIVARSTVSGRWPTGSGRMRGKTQDSARRGPLTLLPRRAECESAATDDREDSHVEASRRRRACARSRSLSSACRVWARPVFETRCVIICPTRERELTTLCSTSQAASRLGIARPLVQTL